MGKSLEMELLGRITGVYLPFKGIVRLFSKAIVPFYIFAFAHLYYESYFSLHSMEIVTLFMLTISLEVEVSGKIPVPAETWGVT